MHANPRPWRDCRLYTFVDAAYLRGRDPGEIAEQLCAGGADIIQLRAKTWTPGQIAEVARAIRPITRRAGVRFVVNDHPTIAAAVGADLVHLGQEDFFDSGCESVEEVKPPDAPDLRVGLSTHAPEQAIRAVKAGADYVAIGPVYATPTKPGRPPVTLDYVRWARREIAIPWFAIGGIHLGTLDDVLRAGAQRICVVSAILNADDVQAACRTFADRLMESL